MRKTERDAEENYSITGLEKSSDDTMGLTEKDQS